MSGAGVKLASGIEGIENSMLNFEFTASIDYTFKSVSFKNFAKNQVILLYYWYCD